MAGFLSPRRVLGRGAERFFNTLVNSANFRFTVFSEVRVDESLGEICRRAKMDTIPCRSVDEHRTAAATRVLYAALTR
jgi:hypothetical protein